MTELVVLLDADGTPVGTADKAVVHTATTPLHLAFSCHVRRASDGAWLMTRRALGKAAWPGVWSNAFCGHPAPGEDLPDAIARRASDELGLEVRDVACVLPEFRYDATDASGIREFEVCPVYTAVTDHEPRPAPDEVVEFAWASPADVRTAVTAAPWAFSPWLGWQLEQLARLDRAEPPVQAAPRDDRGTPAAP